MPVPRVGESTAAAAGLLHCISLMATVVAEEFPHPKCDSDYADEIDDDLGFEALLWDAIDGHRRGGDDLNVATRVEKLDGLVHRVECVPAVPEDSAAGRQPRRKLDVQHLSVVAADLRQLCYLEPAHLLHVRILPVVIARVQL